MKKRYNSFKKKFKNFYLIICAVTLIILSAFLISAFSNLEINATNYSGAITTGSASGNITASSIDGSTASFWQHAAGYLNDTLFTGIHGFSFNVPLPTGNLPTISIVLPENKTYLKLTNIPLNFTSPNALYTWYNLDGGGGANTTITANTTFSTTSGLHTLYLWANNTYGTDNTNITFTANNTKFIILYNNYSGSTKGASNDFNSSTYEDIQDLSDIILENRDYGKMKFNEAINLTNDSTYSDNILDLDSYTSISNNSIIVNSTFLPNFNKSATLYLYNLSFKNPRILKDGALCSATICARKNYTVNFTFWDDTTSYSGGLLAFNVTEFSKYSAEETPEENQTTIITNVVTTPGGGGGGGGVATTTITPIFSINRDQVFDSLKPGQMKIEEIIITNTATNAISIKIDNSLPEFVIIGENGITLNPGQSTTLLLYIMAKPDTIPDLYLGKIILSSGNTKKEILIAIEVESEGALLDVSAEINKNYKEILPGENILAQIKLFNLGGEGRKDINMEYIIRDYDNNTILTITESLAIETQITFMKEIMIPNNAKIGNYVLYVKAIYEGKIASSSDNFKVVSSKVTEREKVYILTIIILFIILSFIIYYVMSRREKKKKVAKINLGKIMRR